LIIKGKFLYKKTEKAVRVRFAPSPTGKMHLGNVRIALENYLFAKKHQGSFVLRIEDTDAERNFDPDARKIIETLAWLNLSFDEGPIFQSQRKALYQKYLALFEQKKLIYRCFCSQEELEKKRDRQIALKKPPRYDRTCYQLNEQQVADNVTADKPFVWRFHIDETQHLSFTDIARGVLHFDLANFSDFSLTRQDGSFTFIFTNAIDDWDMAISHVLRGDDHLSNTVSQIAMFQAVGAPIPLYWHLPLLCNKEGKKLSKRDFGFSVEDLKNAGYLPEALVNYLGVIGASVQDEILTIDQLVSLLPDHPASPNNIKYDLDKLNWVNHKWIERMATPSLVAACSPFLAAHYDITTLDQTKLTQLLTLVQTDLITLGHCVEATRFYFQRPTSVKIQNLAVRELIKKNISLLPHIHNWEAAIKQEAKSTNLPLSTVFPTIRAALTGSPNGPHLRGLIEVLGTEEARVRLEAAVD
jgi:glutamyl-tRNA synthetase